MDDYLGMINTINMFSKSILSIYHFSGFYMFDMVPGYIPCTCMVHTSISLYAIYVSLPLCARNIN